MADVVNIADHTVQFGGVLKNDEKLQDFAKSMMKEMEYGFSPADVRTLQREYNQVPTGMIDDELFEALMDDIITTYQYEENNTDGSDISNSLIIGLKEVRLYF